MATTPPPPTRASMTKACLSSSVIRLVRRRASTSLLPPAAKPITVVTGFEGQSVGCAPASDASNAVESARAPRIAHRKPQEECRGEFAKSAGMGIGGFLRIEETLDLATRFGLASSHA